MLQLTLLRQLALLFLLFLFQVAPALLIWPPILPPPAYPPPTRSIPSTYIYIYNSILTGNFWGGAAQIIHDSIMSYLHPTPKVSSAGGLLWNNNRVRIEKGLW